MSKKYKIGLIIEGDGKGGIKAITDTNKSLTIFQRQLTRTTQNNQSFMQSLGKTSLKMGAAGAALASVATLAGTFATVLKTDTIHELNSLARSVDVSVDSLSSWSYAAQSVGLSSDKMGDIFKDTSDKIGDFVATGGGEAKDLFDNLNLSIDELKQLHPDQQLLAIADGLEQVGTHGEKVFYLESLADEASRLLPLLEQGATGLLKMQREADLLGVTLSDVDAAKVEHASDSFRVLGGAAEGFANQLTVQLSAAFAGVGENVLELLEQFGGMSGVVETVVNNTVAGLGVVINTIHAIEIILKTIGNAWLQLAVVAGDALAQQAQGVVWLIEQPLDKLTDAIGFIMDGWAQLFEAVGEFLGETGQSLTAFGGSVRAASIEVTDFNLTTQDITNAQAGLKTALANSTSEIERMKAEAPGDSFVADWQAAQHSIEQQSKATVALGEANDQAQTKLQQTTAAALEQTEQASAYAQSWESAVERIDEAFASGWLDLIQGNATDVFQSVLGGFEQMLAEMLHLAVTKPILLNVQAGIESLFGSGFGGSGFNIGSLFSAGDGLLGGGIGGSILGVGNTLMNVGSSLGFSGLGAFGSGFASTGAILGTQGVFGGLGTSLTNISSLFGSGSVLGGIGAALPVVGLVAGAAQLIDSISGGKLFGSGWQYDDHGLNVRYANGQFSGHNYLTEVKQRSLFRGRKWRTEETPLDDAVVQGMNQYFDGVESLILSAANELGIDSVTQSQSVFGGENPGDWGFDGSDWREEWERFLDNNVIETTKSLDDFLKSYSSSFELSLKDLSDEEAQAAIQQWASQTTNELVNTIFGDALDGLAVQGENLGDTLSRVMRQLALVDQGFASVNVSLETLASHAGVSELVFSDDVVQQAGGGDRLTALLQGYQSAFFTEEELISLSLESMADQVKTALNDLGLAYGDDFRARFEQASDSGLSASELVNWLEAGNLVGQFEALGERLAEVMQIDDPSGILQGYFANAALIQNSTQDSIQNNTQDSTQTATQSATAADGTQAATQEENAQAAQIADPIVSEVASLNTTVNDTIGSTNSHLVAIDSRLGEVNASIASGLQTFTTEVKAWRMDTDSHIAQLSRHIANIADQTATAQQHTATMIQDVTRLITDKRQTPPIFDQPPLL